MNIYNDTTVIQTITQQLTKKILFILEHDDEVPPNKEFFRYLPESPFRFEVWVNDKLHIVTSSFLNAVHVYNKTPYILSFVDLENWNSQHCLLKHEDKQIFVHIRYFDEPNVFFSVHQNSTIKNFDLFSAALKYCMVDSQMVLNSPVNRRYILDRQQHNFNLLTC